MPNHSRRYDDAVFRCSLLVTGSLKLYRDSVPFHLTFGGSCYIRASRVQARTTVGREFPLSPLAIVKRGPRSALGHVSCALSDIPYVALSPGGFTPQCLHDQPSHAPCDSADQAPGLHTPSFPRVCDTVFVACAPVGTIGWHYQPAAEHARDHCGPRACCHPWRFGGTIRTLGLRHAMTYQPPTSRPSPWATPPLALSSCHRR